MHFCAYGFDARVSHAFHVRAVKVITSVLAFALITQIGCNSAMFQKADIADGSQATLGVTRVEDGEQTDVSDYSVFLKGSIGRRASRSSIGYEIGLTFIAPLRNKNDQAISPDEARAGTFPNQWAGVFPEFKLQVPRRLPIDVALDLRLMTYLPERIAIIASKDISDKVSIYGSYAYATSMGGIATLGTEITLRRRFAFYLEHTRWLNRHHYPDSYKGSPLEHPYSFGIAFKYFWPAPPRPINPMTAMAKK